MKVISFADDISVLVWVNDVQDLINSCKKSVLSLYEYKK